MTTESSSLIDRANLNVQPSSASSLRRSIGRFQFFALAFGTIIGSAWVVVLGDWLRIAGPGGAVLGFVAGGALMTLMAAAYAELSSRMPEAGGEFVYAYKIFGPRTGFAVGWFVTLYLVAVTAFEAIALPWMLQTVFPSLKGSVVYSLLGEEITLDAILIGVGCVVLITFLNVRDVRWAVAFQTVVTYGFLAIALAVLLIGGSSGSAANIQPLFASETNKAWWVGALWIFANSAFFLNGFQAIPQAIEERNEGVSSRTIATVMMMSVIAGALFYCIALLCSALAAPWRELAHTPLATAVAVEGVFSGGSLSKIMLLAAAASLLKTWNAVALMAARILMAQGRVSLLPERFSAIHPRFATPSTAVYFVGLCSLCGVFLGRGAVLPLVNMSSICLAFTFVLGCFGVMKLRRQSAGAPSGYRVPGGIAVLIIGAVSASVMALIALFEPLTRERVSVPLEWILMGGWAVVGLVFLTARQGLRPLTNLGH